MAGRKEHTKLSPVINSNEMKHEPHRSVAWIITAKETEVNVVLLTKPKSQEQLETLDQHESLMLSPGAGLSSEGRPHFKHVLGGCS